MYLVIFEHILVMERKIGRFLKPDEHVHDINKRRDENRLENLKLIANQQQHARIHAVERHDKVINRGVSYF